MGDFRTEASLTWAGLWQTISGEAEDLVMRRAVAIFNLHPSEQNELFRPTRNSSVKVLAI